MYTEHAESGEVAYTAVHVNKGVLTYSHHCFSYMQRCVSKLKETKFPHFGSDKWSRQSSSWRCRLSFFPHPPFDSKWGACFRCTVTFSWFHNSPLSVICGFAGLFQMPCQGETDSVGSCEDTVLPSLQRDYVGSGSCGRQIKQVSDLHGRG